MSLINRKDSEQYVLWRTFLVNISLIIILFIFGIFIGVFVRNSKLINNEIITRARSHFKNIVLTRRWSANYGGVFVEKKEGIESNPYLENPDIETKDGVKYTKKNPSLMTKEISEYAMSDSMFAFHITSLNPLNPDNMADSFEQTALRLFESENVEEYFEKEEAGGKVILRYMAPLMTEDACLQCHAKQGYKVGEIRGGISVILDISTIEKQLATQKYIIILLSVISLSGLLGTIYYHAQRIIVKLNAARLEIEKLSVTDELTGLYNRRFFWKKFADDIDFSRRYKHGISCMIFDVDHFKKVNDTYGHTVGDFVLRKLADTASGLCRASDTLARYGGEEFAVIMLETDLDGVVAAAEKIRQHIKATDFSCHDAPNLSITISIGVVGYSHEQLSPEITPEDMIKIADGALYCAKEEGRDRVSVANICE